MVLRQSVAILAAFLLAGSAHIAGSAALPAQAQPAPTPFACDGTFYLMQGAAGRDQFGRIVFPPPGSPGGGSYENISTAGFEFNALGFNHEDGFIYGMTRERGGAAAQVFRLGSDGNFVLLGVPTQGGFPVNEESYLAGAFLPNGTWVTTIGAGREILRININSTPPTVLSRNEPSQNVQFADMAVNPVDNQVYAFDRITGGIIRIDPATGMVVPAGGTAPGEIRDQGSTWIDGQGRITLLGSSLNGGGGGSAQDTFYSASFDPGSGTYTALQQIGVEPGLSGSGDGASCAYRMVMDKTVSPGTVPAGGTVTYTYRITNGTASARTFTFQDTMADGRTFVPGSVTVSPPTGNISLGGNSLTIGDMSLAEDASVTITAAVAIPATASSATVFNQAALTGLPGGVVLSDFPGNPNPSDPTPLVVQGAPPPPPSADLAITKTLPGGGTSNIVDAGAIFDYTIMVTNNGPAASPASTTTDQVPAGLTPISASGGGVINGQAVTWALGALAPGASVTRTLVVQAGTGSPPTASNTASVTPGGGVPDNSPGNNTSPPVVTTIVPAPVVADLRITKTLAGGGTANTARPGDTFEYHATIINDGPGTAPPSTATDQVPAGLTPVSASDGGIISGQTVTWSLGTLPPGASALRTLQVQVNTTDVPATASNTATVTPGPGAVDDPANNTSTPPVVTTITPAADLSITKAAPATALPGAVFTYTLTVANAGPFTATSSVVTDVIPAGFTPVPGSASDGGVISGQTVTWNLGAIPAGATATLTVQVTAPADGGTAVNIAHVDPGPGAPPDPTPGPANDSPPVTTTVDRLADLAVTKSGPPFAEAGSEFTWTIELTNNGPSTASGVTMTDTVPAGFAVGTPSNGGTVAPGPGGTTIVTWVVGDVAPGSLTFTVPVTAPGVAGSGTNSVAVTTTTTDPTPDNNSATHTVAVRGFTLAKAVTPAGSVRPGDTVTYTIVVTNPSAVAYDAANGLASFRDDLTDVLDDAALTALEPAAEIIADATGFTWTGPIPAGGSRTITVTFAVDSPTDDGDDALVNVVIGGTNCGQGSTDPACTTAPLPVRELGLTKSADKATVQPGESLTFTVTVTNTGGYGFTGADPAAVSDDLSGVLDDATFVEAVTQPPGVGTFGPVPTPGAPVLTWSGPLAAGASVQLVYTVTVNNPQTGDGRLANLVSSVEDPRCLPAAPCGPPQTPLVKALLLDKSVDAPASGVAPNDEVTYTITVTNSGQVPFTEANGLASFTDDLADVVDDATIVSSAADVGTVTFNADETAFTWSGPLPVANPPGTPGATITVTVRVRNPNLTGNHLLANVVSGSANCPPPPGSPGDGAECTAGPPVPVKGLTVSKAADVAIVRAGATVQYTITVTNTGEVDYTAADPATVVDSLTSVLDDAAYNNDAAATNGEPVVFDPAAGTLTWSGPLPAGTPGSPSTITITYSVTVDRPGDGDHVLRNVVTADDSNCPTAPDDGTAEDERCSSGDIPVAEIRVTKVAGASEVAPGGTLSYTIMVSNIGKVDYQDGGPVGPATLTDDLSAVLDDAVYSNDATATAGSTSFSRPTLSWRGPLPVNGSVKITYTVRVNDPTTGDRAIRNAVIAPDSNCPCSVSTPVVPKPAPGPVPPGPPGGGLPVTGLNASELITTGMVLVLLGVTVLIGAARRRSHG